MMTLHGVDVYIWSPEQPQIPEALGKFKLTMISNRGTRVYPGPAPKIDPLDWSQCRYVSDEPVTDGEVDSLVQDITGRGFRWTKCQKLFRSEGVNLYSEAY